MSRRSCALLPAELGSSSLPLRVAAIVAITIGMLGLTASAQTTVWVAGRDLKTAEATAQDTNNPNSLVPEWSYGYRSTPADTSLTLFSAGQHSDSAYSANLQGWTAPDYLNLRVNSDASNVQANFGSSVTSAIAPEEMFLHPLPSVRVVVRWTAPAAGSFTISAYWRDIDASGGDGGSGSIFVNGSSVYSQSWANGGAQVSANLTLTFASGDLVDFLLDANGSYNSDATAFDATITAIPEPSTNAIVVGCLALLGAMVRRMLPGVSLFFRQSRG